jgi:sterol desaturase/sphingolipid hydroxylase (fatty acid hydroxylase superfamily)
MEMPFTSSVELVRFIVEAYLRIFPMDLVRYLLGAGGVYVIVNLAFSGQLTGRKIRADSPSGAQMRREVWSSLRTVAIFAFSGAFFIATGMELGAISIDAQVSERGWGYFAFNLSALIVLHDAWFYWTHRLIHDPRLFRRFHRTHHKSHNPSPWAAYSFDVGEAFINALYLPIALSFLPSSGVAVFSFLIHMILRNAIGHCGYELFPSWRNGRPVFDWLTTVTHHDLHHTQAGWNYGLYFTWWDRLLGTEYPLYAEKFAQAVRKPLDGSAVAALKTSV